MQPPGSRRRPIRQPLRPERPPAYEKLSDPILVTRAKNGDRRALAALCERHAPRVEKLAGHLLRDPEDARDAAQESLAKLCARIGQFRGESQFGTWLHRLTVNTCRDVATRRRTWEPLPDDLPAPSLPEPPDFDRAELRGCLLELSPQQAQVVVLKDALGFSFEEISAASGLPVGTAKCYAHRGRKRMRDRLGERGTHAA